MLGLTLVGWAATGQAAIPLGIPADYGKGDNVSFTAEKITSAESPIQYDYFHIPHCKAEPGWEEKIGYKQGMNLGQILKGDSFELTNYISEMGTDVKCQESCSSDFSSADVDTMLYLTKLHYEVSLSTDGLPAAVVMNYHESDEVEKILKLDSHLYNPESISQKLHLSGYPLGQMVDDDHSSVVNHLAFRIFYHPYEQGRYSTKDVNRIVGFEVVPLSVKSCDDFEKGNKDSLATITRGSNARIRYSYSINYIKSDNLWATRWDNYLKASDDEAEIHWLSLLDSVLVTASLAIMCAIVLLRTVHQDIARYNNLEDIDEIEAESGWKLLHGDAFRKPWGSRALAGLVGTGIQVIGASGTVIIAGGLGIISPANRGSIGQAAITLFALFGVPAGYIAARLNRLFLANEVSSARSLIVTAITAVACPGVAFALYLLAQFIIMCAGGSSVPVTTVIVIGFLWFFISIPLTILGAYLGYRAEPIEIPCRVNRLPRQVPSSPYRFMASPYFLAFSAGIPIISVAITEIRSVIISMVFHNFYYLIGFVVISFSLMLVTTALVSVVITYMIILTEEWKWWWPAFWSGASAGLYSFIMSLFLVSSVSHGGFFASVVNLCFITMWSMTLGVMLGSVSVLTSLWFIKAIFSSIKID